MTIQCSEQAQRYYNAFTECQINAATLAEQCTQFQAVCHYGVYHVIGMAATFLLLVLSLQQLFRYLKNGGFDYWKAYTLELYRLGMESAIKQATLPAPVIVMNEPLCSECHINVSRYNLGDTRLCADCYVALSNPQPREPLGLCNVCKEPQTEFTLYKGIYSCKSCYDLLAERERERTCSKCKKLKEANQMTLAGGSAPLCNYCYDTEFNSPLGRMREQTHEESKTEFHIVQ